MSFDIWFFKFAKGKSAGLPRERVLEVIHAHAFKEVSEGFYDVHLPNGSEVEVSTRDKDNPENPSSVSFFICGMSDEIVKFAVAALWRDKYTFCDLLAEGKKK